MMAEISYIKVFLDWTDATRKLKDAEKGRLIDALVAYAKGDKDVDSRLTGNEAYVFPMYQLQIDRDREDLEKKSLVNSENGKKGGAPKGNNNAKKQPKQPKTTETSEEKEEEKEEEKDKEYFKKEITKEKTLSRFTPPTLAEVKAYCAERNNSVDADRWIDYYTSNGWMVGKNKMRDWKAAVRTWEKNGYSSKPEKPKKETSFDMALINKRFELGNVK